MKSKGFCTKASWNSPLSKWWAARWMPQPGQSSPVIVFIGQRGNKELSKGLKCL
ncbi:hypothetical protein SAMN05660841_02764 [Sphingobacterium nematocida]|uniref:Uncharacterized protein n=1 Tax=Sphingobacterium nematocida TaxID=1513896 RepID=A0A1T5ESI2_9SPHI|nr:hypothetical protein SAMN05660841_02764 [Sphingobacterium nematocida]